MNGTLVYKDYLSLYNENKVSFEEEGGFSNEDMKSHIKKNILDFDI